MELIAISALLVYFGASIVIYLIHGLLGNTDQQLRQPFHIGSRPVPRAAIGAFMWTLIGAEIGGFLVLFYGVLRELI